ncbi:MAG: hypothetical protein V9F04_01315, partial [Dermatophilaceae bacterium]
MTSSLDRIPKSTVGAPMSWMIARCAFAPSVFGRDRASGERRGGIRGVAGPLAGPQFRLEGGKRGTGGVGRAVGVSNHG